MDYKDVREALLDKHLEYKAVLEKTKHERDLSAIESVMKDVIRALEKHPECDSVIVSTGEEFPSLSFVEETLRPDGWFVKPYSSGRIIISLHSEGSNPIEL